MAGWMLSEAIARDFIPSQNVVSLPFQRFRCNSYARLSPPFFVNLISLIRVKVNFIKQTELSREHPPFRCSILLIFDSIMGRGGEWDRSDRGMENRREEEESSVGTDLGFLQTNLGNEVNGN